MANLTILEPHCSGHRMQYVRWFAQEALAREHCVTLVTLAHCLEHSYYLAMQRECEGQIRVETFAYRRDLSSNRWLENTTTVGLAARELIYHNLFSSYFGTLDEGEYPDLFFIPYLDYCSYAIGLRGSPFGEIPWGGITLRPSFHFRSVGVEGTDSPLHPIKRRLFFRMLRTKQLLRLFTIDETLMQYVDMKSKYLVDKLCFVPDPVRFSGTHSRTEARRKLGISDDAVVLLVYGMLTPRKGIDALLRAAHQRSFPKEVKILLAGQQDEHVKRLLLSPQNGALHRNGSIHELSGFLDDNESHMVFRAADIVWLGYRDHFARSAVLIQAGMMGLPVVACDAGLIGWMTREHNLGISVAVDDTAAVIGAVQSLARNRHLAKRFGENGRKNATAYQSEIFAQRVCEGLRLN